MNEQQINSLRRLQINSVKGSLASAVSAARAAQTYFRVEDFVSVRTQAEALASSAAAVTAALDRLAALDSEVPDAPAAAPDAGSGAPAGGAA